MDSTAPPPTAQDREQVKHDEAAQANAQHPETRQSNTQPQQSQSGQEAITTAAAAAAQTPASIPAPDLNPLPQGDLSNLPLQPLPADLNLLPMVGADGNLLSSEELMNMPLMMPMMMDGGGMLNMSSLPQNNITNGRLLYSILRL